MKRFLRLAFDGAATVSALLCASACGLWAHSYSGADYLYHANQDGSRFQADGLLVREGVIQIDHVRRQGFHFRLTDLDVFSFWQNGHSGPWNWGRVRPTGPYDLHQIGGVAALISDRVIEFRNPEKT